MTLIETLTRFDGRIPRSSYWLGLAVIVLIFGTGRYFLKQVLGLETPGPDGAIVMAWSLFAALPLTAITVKRLNDRGRPAWIGYAAGFSTALFIAAPTFGFLAGDIREFSVAEQLVFWCLLPLSLFVLVEAGLLRGRDYGERTDVGGG